MAKTKAVQAVKRDTSAGKDALVAGCSGRRCSECGTVVIVPLRVTDWRTCVPCRNGWS